MVEYFVRASDIKNGIYSGPIPFGKWVGREFSPSKLTGNLTIEGGLGAIIFRGSVCVAGRIKSLDDTNLTVKGSVSSDFDIEVNGDLAADGDVRAGQSLTVEGKVNVDRGITVAQNLTAHEVCVGNSSLAVGGDCVVDGDVYVLKKIRVSGDLLANGDIISLSEIDVDGILMSKSSISAGGKITASSLRASLEMAAGTSKKNAPNRMKSTFYSGVIGSP